MIEELKEIFAPQVRVMKYQYFSHFISARMEENSSLEEHLDIMINYHEHLVDLDYGMTEIFAIDGVLHSLPPATKILSQAISCKENRSPSMNSWLCCGNQRWN